MPEQNPRSCGAKFCRVLQGLQNLEVEAVEFQSCTAEQPCSSMSQACQTGLAHNTLPVQALQQCNST